MLRTGQMPILVGLMILITGLVRDVASAQPVGLLASKSYSGQFVIVSAPVPRVDRILLNSPSMLELDPTLLPISCERVKQHIYRELQASPVWQSKVYLELHRAVPDVPGVSVTCERFQNAWQYRLSLPNPVDRVLFVRSVVQVILMELANRANTGALSAEVPTWLIEGFTRQLLSSRSEEILLTPPAPGRNNVAFTPTFVSEQENPFRTAHAILSRSGPLSFDGLSWPSQDQLLGPSSDVYGASAHLFLSRLMLLPSGRERLRNMIVNLSGSQNWQFVFLNAFAPQFRRTLDVEKWWALEVVNFTGHQLGPTWPLPESWKKVHETLRVPVNIHQSTNSLPSQSEVPLQTALRHWKEEDQRRLVQQKARELEMLRLRVATNLIPIVEEYRMTLNSWLQDNTRGPVLFGLGRKAAQGRASEHTARELDQLDKRFLEMEGTK